MIENVKDVALVEELFSNARLSGGGKISKTQIAENGSVILFFQSPNTAFKVLNQNQGVVKHDESVYRAKKVQNNNKEPMDKSTV